MNQTIQEVVNALEGGTFSTISVEAFAPDGKWAYHIAKFLGRDMKITQLRKVFNTLKQIEIDLKGKEKDDPFQNPKLYMLVPQLAYARARGLIEQDFYNLLRKVIGDANTTKIKTVGDFNRFVDFMTSIVAYHKQFSK